MVQTGTDANIHKRYFPIFHFCFVCVSRSGLRPFSTCYCATFPSSVCRENPFSLGSSGNRFSREGIFCHREKSICLRSPEKHFLAKGPSVLAKSPFASARRESIFLATGSSIVAKSPFASVRRETLFLGRVHLSRKVHFPPLLTASTCVGYCQEGMPIRGSGCD